MRLLPHEELECCPECGALFDLTVSQGYTTVRGLVEGEQWPVITGIYCDACGTDLHLYWFLDEFVSAMYSAYREDLIGFDSDGSYYVRASYDSVLEELDSLVEDSFDVRVEMARIPLCCDEPAHLCACSNPIFFYQAKDLALENFEDLSDLYAYRHSTEGKSCSQCLHYCEPSCPSLRSTLHLISEGFYQYHQPIRSCDHFQLDSSYEEDEFYSY